LASSDKKIKLGLLYIIDSVKSKRNNVQQGYTGVWRDAKLLEKAMKGAGTNDEALSYRCVAYLISFFFGWFLKLVDWMII
jgi:hypothetical protein